MKVIMVGFTKCGTKTMAVALRMLGYTVYDYGENSRYLRDEWIKILTRGGTKKDLYEMYKNVDAVTDVPASIFWEEILEAFPDAKLVFTRRKNEDEWWASFDKQMQAFADNTYYATLPFFSPTAYRNCQYSHHVGRVAFGCPPQRFNRMFMGTSSTVSKKFYRNHNTSVLTRAPKDKLLQFDLREGWEPLCKFLGKPVPDEKFPHKNKKGEVLAESMKESPFIRKMKNEMYITVSTLVVLLAIFIFFSMGPF